MTCPRCGEQMRGGVCPSCGFPVNMIRGSLKIRRYADVVQNASPKSSKHGA